MFDCFFDRIFNTEHRGDLSDSEKDKLTEEKKPSLGLTSLFIETSYSSENGGKRRVTHGWCNNNLSVMLRNSTYTCNESGIFFNKRSRQKKEKKVSESSSLAQFICFFLRQTTWFSAITQWTMNVTCADTCKAFTHVPHCSRWTTPSIHWRIFDCSEHVSKDLDQCKATVCKWRRRTSTCHCLLNKILNMPVLR